ncbi:hypothetical protein MUO79_10140, partial [Candidatus Bathyarchaeota archaeon]|nr:hypothetical protein [Candidatus Bathyarchaeota archaeon]
MPSYKFDWKTGKLIQQYVVDMSQFKEQILPAGYPQTLVWGYGGLAKDAITGQLLGYVRNSPGPTFEAIRYIPVQVKWVNKIKAPYMFAVDPTIHWADPTNPSLGTMRMWDTPYPTYPGIFTGMDNQGNTIQLDAQSPVPLVTHLHGGEVQSTSDGGPEAWFTASGLQGPTYSTTISTSANSAVYYYPNEQLPTTLWYHDHALGVTRLNVMSGLAGFYLL